MTREDIIKLPKVELHCHLDGSLRVGNLWKRDWEGRWEKKN